MLQLMVFIKKAPYIIVAFASIHLFLNQPELTLYSETRDNEYIERIHQMSYSSLSDNGMLQIFSF